MKVRLRRWLVAGRLALKEHAFESAVVAIGGLVGGSLAIGLQWFRHQLGSPHSGDSPNGALPRSIAGGIDRFEGLSGRGGGVSLGVEPRASLDFLAAELRISGAEARIFPSKRPSRVLASPLPT